MKFPTIKPPKSTLEIVVFGKGYGESILVHIYDEKYILIDSFINPETKNPIALDYLYAIGLTSKNLCGIICTHWDSDHIQGINKIIDSCANKIVVYTPIIFDDKKLLEYVQYNKHILGSNISEFSNLLDKHISDKIELRYANTDRYLFPQITKITKIGDSSTSIIALSPNDKQYSMFINSLLVPQNGDIKLPSSLGSNNISIVVYLNMILDHLLLGADMENSTVGGWDSIVDGFTYGEKCHVFKIPHHGSATGFNGKVWDRLVDKPISIITRFNLSGLPTEEYKNKILDQSTCLYIVGGKKQKDKDLLRSVQHTTTYNDTKINVLDGKVGFVRLQKESVDSDWKIEIYGQVEEYQHQ